MANEVILGLGSNVGDRLSYLLQAITIIKENNVILDKTSPIYESEAVLKDDAPEEWNIPYLNMAISAKTKLTPEELLKLIKNIEQGIGRKYRGLWAPREIDIDILAYGDMCINSNSLIIPHQHLCQRPFALLPFADIKPNWRYPGKGLFRYKTIRYIANNVIIEPMPQKTGLECKIKQN